MNGNYAEFQGLTWVYSGQKQADSGYKLRLNSVANSRAIQQNASLEMYVVVYGAVDQANIYTYIYAVKRFV